MPTVEELKRIATQVRRDILRMTNGAASGHPGGSLGCADLLVTLYFQIMKPDPAAFAADGTGEDLFFLSNGHVCPAWYATLARYGYYGVDELSTFRTISTRLQGHPTTHDGLPGVRMSSGSLGQGLSVAAGAALAKKLNGDDRTVWCLTGDGELQEGQNWEAILFAAAHKVDNLVAIADVNGKQIDGNVSDVLDLGDLGAKLTAFGWEVTGMNGNDIVEVIRTLDGTKSKLHKGKPVFVVMRTHMGQGVDFMTDNHEWHGVAPDNEQLQRALAQLPETLGDY